MALWDAIKKRPWLAGIAIAVVVLVVLVMRTRAAPGGTAVIMSGDGNSDLQSQQIAAMSQANALQAQSLMADKAIAGTLALEKLRGDNAFNTNELSYKLAVKGLENEATVRGYDYQIALKQLAGQEQARELSYKQTQDWLLNERYKSDLQQRQFDRQQEINLWQMQTMSNLIAMAMGRL